MDDRGIADPIDELVIEVEDLDQPITTADGGNDIEEPEQVPPPAGEPDNSTPLQQLAEQTLRRAMAPQAPLYVQVQAARTVLSHRSVDNAVDAELEAELREILENSRGRMV